MHVSGDQRVSLQRWGCLGDVIVGRERKPSIKCLCVCQAPRQGPAGVLVEVGLPWRYYPPLPDMHAYTLIEGPPMKGRDDHPIIDPGEQQPVAELLTGGPLTLQSNLSLV